MGIKKDMLPLLMLMQNNEETKVKQKYRFEGDLNTLSTDDI